MKKLLLSIGLLSVLGLTAVAQPQGGIPFSFSNKIEVTNPVISFAALDMDAIEEQDLADNYSAIPKPLRIALPIEADIDMNKYNNITYLDNGDMVWSIAVSVPGAKAIDVYFDKLNLPKGASVFFYNENRKQIDGAYTQEQVTVEGFLRSNYIQGETVYVEINLPVGTNIEDCAAHINRLGAYYRGELPLTVAKLYADVSGDMETEANPNQDDACYVNANCDGWGTRFYEMKQTAVHLDMGGFVCSGNMINNTALDCTPYLLTASHCDGAQSFRNANFANWKMYFNYESSSCEVRDRANVNDYVTGANFVARSNNALSSGRELVADFLLLKLRVTAGNLDTRGWNVHLGGWDNSGLSSVDTSWVFFHHPGGMRKKVSYANSINRNGRFNQNHTLATHWEVDTFLVSGTEGGSSGSAIFCAQKGYIIGDLTGGPNHESICNEMKVRGALYSKLSDAWLNTRGEGGTTDSTSLKKWLDPINSGKSTLGMAKLVGSGCSEIILGDNPNPNPNSIKGADISNAVFVFPNPTSGLVNVKINLPEASDIKVEVVNVLGQVVKIYNVTKTVSSNISVDMTGYNNGIYLINVSTEKATTSKKLVLSK